MNKSIFNLLIVIAIAIAASQASNVKRQAQQSNANRLAECAYFTNTSAVVCLSPRGRIECIVQEVMEQLSVDLPFFAIDRQPLGDSRDFYYPLYYPQSQQSEQFLSSVRDNFRVINFGLFFNPRQNLFGLKVRDFQCWRQLSSYFSSLTVSQPMTVDGRSKQALGILYSAPQQ